MPHQGLFLVVEGLDGSGKSELARRLVEHLRAAHGDDVKLTFEPHDPSCAGQFIRQVLARQIPNVAMRTLALAFAANRMDHLDREIIPFLNQADHRIVVCDRYKLSSLVYQVGPDVSIDQVLEFNAAARAPDLTMFLDASGGTCSARLRKRAQEQELFEVHFEETRLKYKSAIEILRARGEIIVEIDANQSIAEVMNDSLGTLKRHGPAWL